MNGWKRAKKIIIALLVFLSLFVGLPAITFGVLQHWQVIFLLLSYIVFFLATIWRAARYGKLAKTTEDEQYKRPIGRLILAVSFFGIWAVHWLAIYDLSRNKTTNIVYLEMVGISLIIIAIIINQAAISKLKNLFDRITVKSDRQLITNGIYRLVRHPIYLSYLLLFSGCCTLLHGSLFTFILMCLVCGIWLNNRIAIEEEMLIARFGEQYKEYQRKTRKIIPFIY
ncbi:MAG TPA: isoprenylcysteine carboxylmethyltransferase family protein [Leptolyngbyaceae cyanobacterium]